VKERLAISSEASKYKYSNKLGNFMLKPSELGLDGEYRTVIDHKKILVDKISKLQNKKLARVLVKIMESKSGDVIDIADLNQTQINEIKNYYAESVAPVLLFPDSTTARKVKCYFSSSQTEGLYDFKIEWQSKEYLFSNKQLKGGTNTLKAGDVVKLVEDDEILKNKWCNTKEFKVFKILNESNVISGPIKAVRDLYSTTIPTVSKADMTKVINQMTKNDVIIQGTPRSIMNLIRKDEAAYEHYNKKGVVSGTMINYIFEKI
jgi:hypothetical protein